VARRSVHYEAAFEEYLRAKGLPYVAVDEAKKAVFGSASLKSFDFVVYSTQAANLLVDVKGRKFPDSGGGRKASAGRAWENWVTQDDLDGLEQWQGVFGEGFRAVLVFAYWLQGPPQRAPFADVHLYRQEHYAFAAIPLEVYASLARPRSRKWNTLAVPSAEFAAAARDILEQGYLLDSGYPYM
jgi:hypothetical protein